MSKRAKFRRTPTGMLVDRAIGTVKSAIGSCVDEERHAAIQAKLWSAVGLLHKAARLEIRREQGPRKGKR